MVIILILAACFVSGCKNEQQAPKAGSIAEVSGISYRKGSGDYVEVVGLTIRNQEEIAFTGFLLDPFSVEKLKVEIRGTAEFDEFYWSVPTRDGTHHFDLIYWFLTNGDVECVLVSDSEDETRYSGGWAFTGTPN